MPELPEVETIKNDLSNTVTGKIISAVVFPPDFRCRILRRFCASSDIFGKEIQGAAITGVRRRAKYLIFDLDPPGMLIMHLGMSGQILLRGMDSAPDSHVRAIVQLAGEIELRFSDPRTFGELFLYRPPRWTLPFDLDGLGPEPLGPECTAAYLTAVVKKSRRSIKSLLMDKRIVAGIGNIYSDEALFAAAVHPGRPSCSLTRQEIAALRSALRRILTAAIRHRGTSARDQRYRDSGGRTGSFQNRLQVYQRCGQPCRRCGFLITSRRIAGRTASFCPACQHE